MWIPAEENPRAPSYNHIPNSNESFDSDIGSACRGPGQKLPSLTRVAPCIQKCLARGAHNHQWLEQEAKGSGKEAPHKFSLSRRYGVSFREEVHQGEEKPDSGAGNA
jgi:hypothetical protein